MIIEIKDLKVDPKSKLEEENPSLWRYMDYSKFRKLLKSNCLYFASPHQFSDKYEGFPKKLRNADAPGFITSKERTEEILKMNRNLAKISCWHINEHESDGMWKLYGSGNSANSECVAIKTSLEKFRHSFYQSETAEEVIYIEKIIYDEQQPALLTNGINFHKIFAHKRPAFSFEKEVRLIITQGYESKEQSEFFTKGILVKVDLQKLVEAVYLGPGSSEEFKDEVKEKLRSYGLGNVPVKKSFTDNEIDFEFS